MLDSSLPVAFQPVPVPRPLKRSASVASLPTPPRTRHRSGKRRGRSRGSLESDSDSAGDGTSSSGEDTDENSVKSGEKVNTHKRRRTGDTLDEEDAFWLGESVGDASATGERGAQATTRGRGTLRKSGSFFRAKAVTSDPEPGTTDRDVPLIYQRLQQHREHQSTSDLADTHDGKTKAASTSVTLVAPVSPPPSRRKPTAVAARASPSSPPVTPTKPKKGKNRARLIQDLPVRDSPNNPFLDSPSDDGKNLTLKSPRTPPPYEEKPTITYVFRGVRGVYPNPLYNHAKQRPLSPLPESLLPPEHPDFSPDMRCPPRLLFPEAQLKNRDGSPLASYWSQSSDEFSESPVTPTRTSLSDLDQFKERKSEKEGLLHLPRTEGGGSTSKRKTQRSPSSYQTLGESDDEADDASEAEESHHHDEVGGSKTMRIKPLKLNFGVEAQEDGKRKKKGSRPLDGRILRPNVVPPKF